MDEASDVIDAGLTASTHGADAGCRLLLGISAIGVAAARGDVVTMRSAADRLATELASVPDPPDLLARLCAVAQSQVQLISGHPDQAVTLAVGQGSGYADAAERIALGRTHLSLGRSDLLPALLRPVIESGASFLGLAVEARILLAQVADREHRDTAALTQLTEAIDLAEPENMIRPFLDAGPPLRSLIVRHRHIVARHLEFTQELLVPQALPEAKKPACPANISPNGNSSSCGICRPCSKPGKSQPTCSCRSTRSRRTCGPSTASSTSPPGGPRWNGRGN